MTLSWAAAWKDTRASNGLDGRFDTARDETSLVAGVGSSRAMGMSRYQARAALAKAKEQV